MAGPVATLTVSPASASLAPGASQQFVAGGADGYGNPVAVDSANWSVAPAAFGAVSPGTGGSAIFTAGQAGRNRDTGQMGDVREQTHWALRNIAAILEAAGASLADVVKTTVYLKEGADSAAMSEAYASHFTDPLPARSSVVVARLKNPEMLVEIEAIAVVN